MVNNKVGVRSFGTDSHQIGVRIKRLKILMKHHLLQGQVETIRRVQRNIKTYLMWKDCGTKAKYFTRKELNEHIFHLGVIKESTTESKIAKKAIKLHRLILRILKYEYDESPNVSAIEGLVRRSLQSIQEYEQKRAKLGQTIRSDRRSSIPKDEMGESSKTPKRKRNATDTVSVSQRPNKRTFRRKQDVPKDPKELFLAKNV